MLRINRVFLKAACLFIFLGLSFAPSAMSAPSLNVLDLSDKHITTSDRIILHGTAVGADKVIVNNLDADKDVNGNFNVGLVLVKGKNLIRVVAKFGGSEKRETFRVLRLAKFPDMDPPYNSAKWAKNSIVNLGTIGVIEGYPDGMFGPDKDITRGELATWLVRAKGDKIETPTEDPFFDVPKEHWRAPYINAAAKNNYMSAKSKDVFGIDDKIARTDVAKIIRRAQNLYYKGMRKVFIDVPLSAPAAADVYNVYRAGLFIGITKGRVFDPARPMKRDEAAKVLSRFPGVSSQVLDLYNFETGYNDSRLCKVNQAPTIVWARATPNEVPNDGKTPLVLSAKVGDRQGLGDISQVSVDLRSLGGPGNALMYDDATHGDDKAADGTYALAIVVYEDAELGPKHLSVTVMDKSGWTSSGWIDLKVVKTW